MYKRIQLQLPTLLAYMAESLTGLKLCPATPNKMQQPATTYNRVCKQTQLVISTNGGSCQPTMLHPFAWGVKGLS